VNQLPVKEGVEAGESAGPAVPVLTMGEFRRLADLIQGTYGIKMPPSKKILLEGRLRKRLKALGLTRFREYLEVVFGEREDQGERIPMIDAVTTNKTSFFRESAQLERLVGEALPVLLETRNAGPRDPLRVWSAGCATGEEPASIAMVLDRYRADHPYFDYRILATDLSTRALETARRAVYPEASADMIPHDLRYRYLMRSRDRGRRLVRVVPEIRSRILYHRLNLMDEHYGIRDRMDVIFCRNVIIYFEKETQDRIVGRLAARLRPGGYLFTGHSENLHRTKDLLVQVAPSAYRRIGG
jgi:chemotaxis protein methyltransferase CheR